MKVVVVGGGPAGSRTAELLCRRGARVILFEGRPGWEKPCGGGVPERAVEFCPALDDAGLPQRRATRARIIAGSGREAVVPLAEPLRVFRRCDLNGILLARARDAGVEVRMERVQSLHREDGSWKVTDGSGRTEIADYVVGADGASGTVRARVARHLPPLQHSVGVGYYLEGHTSDEIVLKFFDDLDGYLWIFPRIDHLAAGICGPGAAGNSQALLSELDRFLIDAYGAPILKRRVRYGAKIPAPPATPAAEASCIGEGWALVGDAAGFVDPLTREGIHYALASAGFLAEALGQGNPAAYPKRWTESFGGEMHWAAAHKRLFFSRRFCEAFTLLASHSRPIQIVVSDLIAGRQEYRKLRKRLGALSAAAGFGLAAGLLRRLARPPAASPPSLIPL